MAEIISADSFLPEKVLSHSSFVENAQPIGGSATQQQCGALRLNVKTQLVRER